MPILYRQLTPALFGGLRYGNTPRQFDGNLAVQLTAHNLADAKYASMVYAGYGYYVDNNMGRSVNVSLQYRF
jgi:hypothetical protein